jgi:ribonuclease HII
MRLAWLDMAERFPAAAGLSRYGIVDGKHCPQVPFPCLAQVKGDLLIPAISAASIIAKVTRDRYMEEQAKIFPEYGFARHKGYPTQEHQAALHRFGPCPIHRQSWVSKILLSSSSEKEPLSAALS